MEIIKIKKSCLIFLLLIFNSPFLYPGEALSPAETTEESTSQRKTPAGLPQNGEDTHLLPSPPFPIPATTKTPIIEPLNNRGQQSRTVLPPQQVNYPQQSLNQPFPGFSQPFASTNQPFLGVNQQPFSSFNQAFGFSNQQGLADNTSTLDSGVSKKSSYIIAVPLAFLFAALANLALIF